MRALLLALAGVALAVGARAQTALPRVLVLGDTTQQPALGAVRKALADRVELVFPKGVHANNTGEALTHLDALLGEGGWDLVYFGYGLGDLVYRDPRTKDRRVLARGAGGVRTTSDECYRENLVQLVARLEKTGTPLLWANTTPTERLVIGNSPVDNLFDTGAEVALNGIAAEVMDVHNVPVVDLHAFCMAQFEDGKHPGFLDYARALSKRKEGPYLHEPIVEAILARLGDEEADQAEDSDRQVRTLKVDLSTQPNYKDGMAQINLLLPPSSDSARILAVELRAPTARMETSSTPERPPAVKERLPVDSPRISTSQPRVTKKEDPAGSTATTPAEDSTSKKGRHLSPG
ncbi:MAG TPA: hypothetical protein EYQ25_10025 [Planctomycetes bacterium]|nr:hypothetical protein [Planctomycetota bacterium]HIL38420.1 hypothetical protein [Planctomycetota bacterium]